MIEMGEYASPYTLTMEGFENPTMASVFNDLLTVKVPSTRRTLGSISSSDTSVPTTSQTTTCKPGVSDKIVRVSSDSELEPDTQTSFLRSLLVQQKDTVKSLLETAKTIGPVAQQIEQKEAAYDAAFESDAQASIPLAGGTLQGFAIVLFITSFLGFALVTTVAINQITNSALLALGSFIGFIIFGLIAMSLIVRLG